MALADFIPSEGQRRIADAITAAERHTTGEICVHVTPRCRGNVYKRAVKTFNRLHLYTTKRRNAVLIFIAYEARKFAILGDTGINDAVPEGFWDSESEELRNARQELDDQKTVCVTSSPASVSACRITSLVNVTTRTN